MKINVSLQRQSRHPCGHKTKTNTEVQERVTHPSMVHTHYGNKIYANIKIYSLKWFLIVWQVCARLAVSDSLQRCGSSLCPWDSSGSNTGVGCHSFPRGSSQLRDWTRVFCTSCPGRWILYHCAPWEALGYDKCLHIKNMVLIFQKVWHNWFKIMKNK